MNNDATPDRRARIESELETLRKEMQTLNKHKYIRVHNSWRRMLMFYFVRGLAMGLGTAVGATLLVSVLVFVLSFIDFVPIIGDWAEQIAEQIQDAAN